jgi:hypothetical protein
VPQRWAGCPIRVRRVGYTTSWLVSVRSFRKRLFVQAWCRRAAATQLDLGQDNAGDQNCRPPPMNSPPGQMSFVCENTYCHPVRQRYDWMNSPSNQSLEVIRVSRSASRYPARIIPRSAIRLALTTYPTAPARKRHNLEPWPRGP